MFEKLGSMLRKVTDKIASAIFVDKELIESVVKDLQRALIEADVNVALVHELSQKIKKEAEKNIKGIEKKEQIINLLYSELENMLGGKKQELELKKKNKIMLLGLYGCGKTTTSVKIAAYYAKRGKKTCVIGLDVHRPASMEQLEQLGKKANVKVFIDKQEKNPIKIWKKFKDEVEDYEIVLIDTAGRDVLDEKLIEELKKVDKEIKPEIKILVMPADIGQAAKRQASEFQKSCEISGVIVTRMDSSAKGGGALTACAETKAPVYFITTGEHLQDIETFSASAFISRMLGLGDLQSLIEKVKSVVDEDRQVAMQKRLEEGKITLQDVYEQLGAMSSLGSLDKIKSLIPGLSSAKLPDKMIGEQEIKMKHWRVAISSMTKEEIENPEILEKQTSRIGRIAKGAGIPTSSVRSLIKQYKLLKEFVKTGEGVDLSQGLSQKQLQKIAKKFGKKIRI